MLPLQQEADAHLDRQEENELHAHARERVRVAVVRRAGGGRDGLLLHVERDGDAGVGTAGGGSLHPVVPALDAAQHVDERALVGRRERVVPLDLSERGFEARAPGLAREHLLADGLHRVPRQDPLHHARLGRHRRIVEHADRGFFLRAREKRRGGRLAEAGRQVDGARHLRAPDGVPRLDERGARHGQRRVRRQPGDHVARDGALIVIDDQHGHAGRVLPIRVVEDEPEERRDGDRREHRHEHGAPVVEEQPEVFPDQGREWSQHQSRSVLPVSARNTVSRSARSVTACR